MTAMFAATAEASAPELLAGPALEAAAAPSFFSSLAIPSFSTVSTALMGVNALTSLAGYAGQTNNANINRDALTTSYNTQMGQVQQQYQQVNAAAADQAGVRARDAMIERAKLATVSAESGLSTGVSNDRIQGESFFNEGTDIATIENNRRNQVNQIQANAKGIQAQTQAKMAGITTPSLIGTGLNIVGSSLAIANTDLDRQQRQPKAVS